VVLGKSNLSFRKSPQQTDIGNQLKDRGKFDKITKGHKAVSGHPIAFPEVEHDQNRGDDTGDRADGHVPDPKDRFIVVFVQDVMQHDIVEKCEGKEAGNDAHDGNNSVLFVDVVPEDGTETAQDLEETRKECKLHELIFHQALEDKPVKETDGKDVENVEHQKAAVSEHEMLVSLEGPDCIGIIICYILVEKRNDGIVVQTRVGHFCAVVVVLFDF